MNEHLKNKTILLFDNNIQRTYSQQLESLMPNQTQKRSCKNVSQQTSARNDEKEKIKSLERQIINLKKQQKKDSKLIKKLKDTCDKK